jgi:cytochrome c biogenesis protein CcmG/thiol:disulfide interchange protein DsbE
MAYVRKILLCIYWFIILIAMGANSPASGQRGPVSPSEIDKLERTMAPGFSLKDLSGRTITLSSLKGKVVLLNFWATWCPPCISEMPVFNRLYKEMRSRGLEIVAISADRSEGYLRDYVSKHSLDFRVLYDEDRTVTKQYKVFSMPTTFLIDKNGVIVEKFFGEYDWTDQEIKKKIEKLL